LSVCRRRRRDRADQQDRQSQYAHQTPLAVLSEQVRAGLGELQWRVPTSSSSTKPLGIRGGVNPSLGLQMGQGMPAPPQPQA